MNTDEKNPLIQLCALQIVIACCDLIQRWRRGFSVYDIYISRAWAVYGDSLAGSAEEKAGRPFKTRGIATVGAYRRERQGFLEDGSWL